MYSGVVHDAVRHRNWAVPLPFVTACDGDRDAWLVRSYGANLRHTGELRIEHHRAGEIVDSYTDSAIWELMYVGKTRVSH